MSFVMTYTHPNPASQTHMKGQRVLPSVFTWNLLQKTVDIVCKSNITGIRLWSPLPTPASGKIINPFGHGSPEHLSMGALRKHRLLLGRFIRGSPRCFY